MPQSILRLKDMSKDDVYKTGSKKLINMHLIYDIDLPGLPLAYVIPWWNDDDLEQIKKDIRTISEEAEKQGETLMVRSAHYRQKNEKVLPEVSMPYRVDRKTPAQIFWAVVEVLEESERLANHSDIDVYKPNVLISTFIKDCDKSGMVHVHKNISEIHSLYGNVVAMLRHDYPYDSIIIDRSLKVLDKISNRKNQMMNARGDGFAVESVPAPDQNRLSISEAEIPLFVDHIRIMTKSFPGKEVEAMWLKQRNREIYYSYLDVLDEPEQKVEKILLDDSPISYSPEMKSPEMENRTVYVPIHVLNDTENASNAITFIACSGAKAVLLPKQISQCAHMLKILREMGVYYKIVE